MKTRTRGKCSPNYRALEDRHQNPEKGRKKGTLWILFVFFAFIVSCLYFYSWGGYFEEKAFYSSSLLLLSSSSTSFNSSQITCKLPLNANPWDASLNKYIKRMPSSIYCPSRELLVTSSVNEDGVLAINGAPNKRTDKIKCFLSIMRRGLKAGDMQIVYSKERLFAIGSTLDMNAEGIQFVVIKCLNSYNQIIYSRTHYFPSFKASPLPVTTSSSSSSPKPRNRQPSPPSTRRADSFLPPNVFILVVESLSRLNFLRFLPKTKRALEAKTKLGTQRSHIFTLKGLTKLADNSFPNMTPLLTGRRVYWYENPNIDESYGPYDELPLVWKDFKAKGYMTALLEDHPGYTLFNYESNGFKKQPVDWYPRPYWLHIYNNERTGGAGSSYCYYNRSKIDVLLDQGKLFFDKGLKEKRPTFTFLFYIQVTHEDFNKAQLLDSHLASYIESLDLGSTIFAFMGDHGNRFGSVLETVVGRIEERMPLFTLLIPDYILKKNPSLGVNLKANEERLTTWLDVHQMLTDIPSFNYSQLQVPEKGVLKRAYSLWREEVPKERTCAAALIPENFCVCHQSKDINTSLDVVREASLSLVYFLNLKIGAYSHLCSQYSLNKTKSANLIIPSDSVLKSQGFEQVIELVIEVAPSGGIFRGQVSRRVEDRGVWRLRGEFTRINRYASQAFCTTIKWLKPYCFCRKRKKG